MKGTIDSEVGEDTIAKLERAAKARRAEALVLSDHDHALAAIYLLGYAAEALLGAAVFRSQGYFRHNAISDDQRKRAEKNARALNCMSGKPHDILGWAQYLIHVKQTGLKPYRGSFADALRNNAKDIYDRWRPKIRYRSHLDGLVKEDYEIVRDAADWFFRNHLSM